MPINKQLLFEHSCYVFIFRLVRCEIDRAVNIGYTTLRISATIHAVELALYVYPMLMQALLIRRKVTEAVAILHEIEYYAEEDTDNSGMSHSYILFCGYFHGC